MSNQTDYVSPSDVLSPRSRWKLLRVLLDAGPGKPAVAHGKWDGREVIATRWNGTKKAPKGNPVSTGYPTWFILPDHFGRAILDQISPDVRSTQEYLTILRERFR